MGRLFIIIAILAAATRPDLRELARPALQWALDPLYEWSVSYRLREFAGILESDLTLGRPLPSTATLSGYLLAHGYDAESVLDPWGKPLYVQREYGAVRLGSGGRDLTPHTSDDIRSSEIAEPAS